MVKGFILLTGKYSGDAIFLRTNKITAIVPLKSLPEFERTTDGSAVYLDDESLFEKNYLYVQESAATVMRLMGEAESGG